MKKMHLTYNHLEAGVEETEEVIPVGLANYKIDAATRPTKRRLKICQNRRPKVTIDIRSHLKVIKALLTFNPNTLNPSLMKRMKKTAFS